MFSIWDDHIPTGYKNFDHIPKTHKDAAMIVLKILYGDALGLTKEQLVEKCKIRKQRCTDSIQHLFRLRVIQRQGKGVKGNCFKYSFE